MNKPTLKDPKGGLTPAGRKKLGKNLKPGVKNYSSANTPDKRRWISWALRFYGQENYPPLIDDKGRPTRFALTAAAWGEPVPKTEKAARSIAAKARRRKAELDQKDLKQGATMDVDEFIAHVGVKGMRWGVRKTPASDRSASKWKARKEKENKEEAKKNKKEKKKSDAEETKDTKTAKVPRKESDVQKVRRLNDDELKVAVERLRLEKIYAELSAANRSADLKRKQTKGAAFIKASKEVSATVVKRAATEAGTELLKKEIVKAFGK